MHIRSCYNIMHKFQVKPLDRSVLLSLLVLQDDRGHVNISDEVTFANHCNLDKRSIQKSLDRLLSLGLIKIISDSQITVLCTTENAVQVPEWITKERIKKEPYRTHERRIRSKLSKTLRSRVMKRDRVCQQCGSTTDLTIDHILPIKHGGTNDIENLQVLCNVCNSKKGSLC